MWIVAVLGVLGNHVQAPPTWEVLVGRKRKEQLPTASARAVAAFNAYAGSSYPSYGANGSHYAFRCA